MTKNGTERGQTVNKYIHCPGRTETANFLTQPGNPQPQAIDSFPEFTRLPAIYLVYF